MSHSLTALEIDVLRWADQRKITTNSTSQAQLLKTMSELGELADAVLKRKHEGIKDGIGDVLVTLIIVADREGLSLRQCLAHAYDQIKDRKGTLMPNGVFVKEGDSHA